MAYQAVPAPPLVGVTENFDTNLRATVEGTRVNQAEMITEVVAGRDGTASLAAKKAAQDVSLDLILSTIISSRGSFQSMDDNITDKESRAAQNIIDTNDVAIALAALIAASGSKISATDTTVSTLSDKIVGKTPSDITKTVLNPGGNEVLEITGPGELYAVNGYLKIVDMAYAQESSITLTGPLLGTGKFKASIYEEITPTLLSLKTHLYEISEMTTTGFIITSKSPGTHTVHVYISA